MAKGRKPGKLTRARLRDAAGSVYFSRGEEYFELDFVEGLRERNGVVRATVRGTWPYKTEITLCEGELDGKCSCPLGEDGEFCKHLVATGLAYIEEQKSSRTSKKNKPVTPKVIEAYLGRQSPSELVSIIMDQADIDDEFYALLKLRVAADSYSSDVSGMRLVLKQAMTIRDFVSWRETGSYMRGIDRVLGQIRKMLVPKHAAQVIELVEYGMDLWEENIEFIDDSNGCMDELRDDLHRLHLEACNLSRPDPVVLAERLARRTISTDWDMFYGSYETYREVFGEAGRARYREIVEETWNALPSKSPGEEDPERYGRTGRLERMMLAFAEEDNDVDLAISVLSRDLADSYRYLNIAEFCRSAHRFSLAREWAENGLAAFSDRPDSRLRSFLADEYLRAKRPDDAMTMIWDNFTERASLETYRELAKYARRLKCLDSWRKRAFDHVRSSVKERRAKYEEKHAGISARGKSGFNRWAPRPPDHSLLVEILIWEKRPDEAWTEAQKGGCSEHLWLNLAKRREKKHPEDAVPIYRRQVAPLIEQKKNKSYHEAIDYIDLVHILMERDGRAEEFRSWLQQLKSENKRKRNFIKFVERKAWGK